MRFKINLIIAVTSFANITGIISSNEYAINVDSENQMNDFCTHAGCTLVKRMKKIRFQKKLRIFPRPKDPKWTEMWNLNGQLRPSMRVQEAWSMGCSGSGVTIAVVDGGVQMDHPDLRKNIDSANSYNFNDNDSNTSPTPVDDSFSHGTKVVGLLAAEANNSQCIVGVAHQSKVIVIKLLDGTEVTYAMEADALNHHLKTVDIYTNSWGPKEKDGYFELNGVTESAFIDGVTMGRSGKGSIYVWAAGNGGLIDNCNADGYVNSIYTIPITSVGADGKAAYYAEICAPVFAATYSGNGHKDLISTSLSSSCVGGLRGTSFSVPQAAGMIALALETNPSLTWRDVQHLVVETSKRHNIRDGYSNWQRNGAGFYVSQVLGFGLMDAEALVTRAKTWVSVPHQLYCFSSDMFLIQSRNYLPEVRRTINTKNDCEISSLEHVIVTVSIPYSGKRGNVVVILESPAGTRSELMTPRPLDSDSNSFGLIYWNFSSVHFWGEKVEGIWILTAKSEDISSTQVNIESWKLHFYGFRKDLSWGFFEPISVTQLTSEDQFYRNRNENGISGIKYLLGFIFVIIAFKYFEKRFKRMFSAISKNILKTGS